MRMLKKSCSAALLLLLFGSVAWSDQADSRYTLSFGSFSPLNSDIFIANADGTGKAIKVYSGSVTGVDWGPAPKD